MLIIFDTRTNGTFPWLKEVGLNKLVCVYYNQNQIFYVKTCTLSEKGKGICQLSNYKICENPNNNFSVIGNYKDSIFTCISGHDDLNQNDN